MRKCVFAVVLVIVFLVSAVSIISFPNTTSSVLNSVQPRSSFRILGAVTPSISMLNNNGYSDSDGPVGAALTVAALVEDASGNPLDGVTVSFDIISGPNAGLTGSASTSSANCGLDGIATFSYSSSVSGSDIIQASATVSGIPLTTTTGFGWFEPSSSISLSTSTVGVTSYSSPGLYWSVSGFASQWTSFPADTLCGPRTGHETFVTIADSSGNSFTFLSSPGTYPDGLTGMPYGLEIYEATPGCYQVNLNPSGFTGGYFSSGTGCLSPGTITLTINTDDYVNRIVVLSAPGSDGIFCPGSTPGPCGVFAHIASTTFQFVKTSSVQVPEFPVGLLAAFAVAIPAFVILRAKYSAKP